MGKKQLVFYIACIVILIAFADFIQSSYSIRLLGQNILNIRFWLIVFVTMTLLLDPQALTNSRMLWLYVYFLVYLTFEFLGHYNLTGYAEQTRYGWFRDQHYPLAAALVLIELYRRKPLTAFANRAATFNFWLILIICTTSIIIIFRNPGVVRGSEVMLYGEEIKRLRAIGLGNIPFFSSLPFLIPVVVYKIKNRLGMKVKYLLPHFVALGILLLCSYKAVIIAPFLLSVAASILAFLGRKRIRANFFILLIIVAFYAVVPKSLIGSFFYSAAQVVENQNISLKLSEIGYTFTEGIELVTYDEEARTGIEGRASRIKFNLKEFSRSPVIGTGEMTHAAHIFWLGTLAQFGIIGVVPLIIIILIQVKREVKLLHPDSLFTYYLSMGAFIVLGFMKVIAGYAMFIIPLFLVPILIYQEEEWLIQARKYLNH